MATNLDFSSSYLMGSDRRGMHSPNAAPNCRRALCLTVLGFATGATGWRVLPQQRIGHPPWEHAAQRTFLAAPVARRASSLQRCRLQHTNCMGLSATPSENFQDSNSTPNSSDEGSYAVVNTTTVNQQARPFPRVGDIVQYGGKWRDDLSFGEVPLWEGVVQVEPAPEESDV